MSLKNELKDIAEVKKKHHKYLFLSDVNSSNLAKIKEAVLSNRVHSPNKKEILEAIQARGVQLNKQIKIVNIRKEEYEEAKMARLREDAKKREKLLATY